METILANGVQQTAVKLIKLNRRIESLQVQQSALKSELLEYMEAHGQENIQTRIGTLVYVSGRRTWKYLSKRYLQLERSMKKEIERCKGSKRLHVVTTGNPSVRVQD